MLQAACSFFLFLQMDEKIYQIALTLLPKVGAITIRNLISYCGSPQAVFEARKKELLSIPGIGEQIAAYILQPGVLDLAEAELEFMAQNRIKHTFYLDPDFPARLKPYHDSPAILYYKGKVDFNPLRTVSIVGTRKPSHQGILLCEEIVAGLKPYGVTIVSGLAYGVDITAHKKCIEENIPTIGSVAHGLGHIYPAKHKHIALEMLENGGLISEYPSKTIPDKERFPMRNRIIAGMADALIVVESARKGGSMITAKFAGNYNKDIFAIPGRVKDKQAAGCNWLIKTHQAALLESADDIGYIMGWQNQKKEGIQQKLFVEYSPSEKIVVDLLSPSEPIGIDQLTYQSQLTNSKMSSLLLSLEFKGAVKSIPGNRYLLI